MTPGEILCAPLMQTTLVRCPLPTPAPPDPQIGARVEAVRSELGTARVVLTAIVVAMPEVENHAGRVAEAAEHVGVSSLRPRARVLEQRRPPTSHAERARCAPVAASGVCHQNAEMAAREMGGLSLADALSLCELLAASDPKRYERAALPWLQRFIDERLPPLAEVALAASARAELRRGERSVGVDALKGIVGR
jgi:hypothetical protein